MKHSDFYVTCATVIPVLFLALAVQGQIYESLNETSLRLNNAWKEQRLTIKDALLKDFASLFLVGVALAIVVAGGLGEGAAIWVLYRGAEFHTSRTGVLLATLLLVAVVALSPVVSKLLSKQAANGDSDRGQADPGEDQSGRG